MQRATLCSNGLYISSVYVKYIFFISCVIFLLLRRVITFLPRKKWITIFYNFGWFYGPGLHILMKINFTHTRILKEELFLVDIKRRFLCLKRLSQFVRRHEERKENLIFHWFCLTPSAKGIWFGSGLRTKGRKQIKVKIHLLSFISLSKSDSQGYEYYYLFL